MNNKANTFALFFGVATCVALFSWGHRAQALPGKVLSKTPSPGSCTTGAAWDGSHLWVADHKTDRLSRVHLATGKTVRSIPSPGYRPGDLAWDGKYLWSLDAGDKALYKIDVWRGLVVNKVDCPVSAPRGLAWDGSGLWITDAKTQTLRKLDPDDGTTIKSLPSPSKRLTGLTWDGRYLWASDRLADEIYLVSPRRGEVIFAIPSPGAHPTGLAYDGKHLLVADYGTDLLYKVVRDDGKKVRRTLKKTEHMEFTYQVRNFGPSTLKSLTVHMAVPQKELTHRLKTKPAFSPTPKGYVKDRYGQRFAKFKFKEIPAGRFVSVGWKAEVELYDVRHYVFPHKVGSAGRVPGRIKRLYLKNATKYAMNHPFIQKAVKKAVGSEKNLYWRARRIYRYIHQRIHYELAGGWNTAPRVLKRGSGSCSEYSFVFISMCRAAGIPARYVGSVVLRKDDASFDDVFHRWVEIYLPGFGWLPVDPSRGDKPTEAQRGDAFHHLTADFLITTRGGGNSRYLGWTYNAKAGWVCRGRCKVAEENIAEWAPVKKP